MQRFSSDQENHNLLFVRLTRKRATFNSSYQRTANFTAAFFFTLKIVHGWDWLDVKRGSLEGRKRRIQYQVSLARIGRDGQLIFFVSSLCRVKLWRMAWRVKAFAKPLFEKLAPCPDRYMILLHYKTVKPSPKFYSVWSGTSRRQECWVAVVRGPRKENVNWGFVGLLSLLRRKKKVERKTT